MALNRAQQEDFNSFVRARSTALLRSAHLLTGDRGHAEDLLQQALERLARHWTLIDGDPEGYARRTLVNLATDRWRLRARRPRESGPGGLEQVAAADPHRAVEQHFDLVLLLRELTPRQRAVLVLRYFEDLSEEQTTQVMRCSVGTVKSTSSRALAILRARTAPDTETAEAGSTR